MKRFIFNYSKRIEIMVSFFEPKYIGTQFFFESAKITIYSITKYKMPNFLA